MFKRLQSIRKWVRKLVYAKNKMMKEFYEFEEYNIKNVDFNEYPISKQDHLTMIKQTEDARINKILTPFIIWKLDKKKEGEDLCDEYEFSE
mmetsp:Transcript_17833/g.15740  ORF Transcript_17833/g.15740 Transcript_17833/m.15740 type:complete len:91 (+) Transcript_17833:689-961(+)